MPDLRDASALFESNYNQLLALVLRRMAIEMQYHPSGELKPLEADLIEQFREFGELLRVVYRYDLTDVLAQEAAWYASALSSRGSAHVAFKLLVESWIIAIQGTIRPQECNLLSAPLRELLNNESFIFDQAGQRGSATPDNDIVDLVDRLIVGDREQSLALLTGHVKSGINPPDLITRFILPALVEIGRRWESNEIQIFEEHLASETIIRLLAGFSSDLPRAEPVNRQGLVSCVPNEKHQLVPMALTAFLELKGWQVTSLGSSLPASQILLAVKKLKPDAVFLSFHLLSRLTESMELVSQLNETCPGSQILIGGNGAHAGKSLLEASGATVVDSFDEAHLSALKGSPDNA